MFHGAFWGILREKNRVAEEVAREFGCDVRVCDVVCPEFSSFRAAVEYLYRMFDRVELAPVEQQGSSLMRSWCCEEAEG